MEHHGNINMLGKGALVAASIAVDTNFPSNPQVGRFLFKDRRLFVCVDISTLPVWVPITQEIDVYHHVQSTPALEWSIPHNLGSARVMVQVFNQSNIVISPDEIDCSVKDMVTVRFPIPYAGAAIVQLGETLGQPKQDFAFTQSFTGTDTCVVNHGLGYNPEIVAVQGGYVVQPTSVVYNSLNQCTVTFAVSGNYEIRCV